MSRRVKRELIARILSIIVVITPITLGILGAITLYTLLGWEGRAGAVVGIGGVFTIAGLFLVLPMWERYGNARDYSHCKGTSFLLDWIEEEEKVKVPKEDPKAGAWKEKE